MASDTRLAIRAGHHAKQALACPVAAILAALVAFSFAATTSQSVSQPKAAGDQPSPRGDALALYQAGMTRFAAGDLVAATELFQRALPASTGYLRLCSWNMIGQAARLRQDTVAALNAFTHVSGCVEDSVSTAPTKAVAQSAQSVATLALLYRAEICEEQEEWQEAIRLYEALLLENPMPPEVAELLRTPELYEKLARLYWRVSDLENALQTFRAIVARWPNYPRAPLVKVEVATLELCTPDRTATRRMAFLGCPVGDGTPPPPAPLDELPDAVWAPLRRLGELLQNPKGLAKWQPLVRLHYAWMLFEAGRLERARSQFEQVVALCGDNEAFDGTLGDYARVGLALALMRQQRGQEALEVARGIPPRAVSAHVHEVAKELTGSISRNLDQKKMTDKCNIVPLD